MPFTLSSRIRRARSGPRRRSLLAGAAGAVLLAGCTDDTPGASADKRSGATERARARVARDSAELADRYTAVIAAHPALADRLRPLRAAARQHAKAFGGVPRSTPAPSGSATPSPSSSVPVPTGEKEALSQLAAAERKLADARRTALLDLPGEQARLLASVAAAGDAHVYLLTEAGR
ncbi:hypothetical protein U9R90_08700 [Streptomyces sp. E11-3]|uniref:hypothetical protein n=1 Tax=Streptomyces sp. E11-3 TaxID=3110112 RepID=UPI003980D773